MKSLIASIAILGLAGMMVVVGAGADTSANVAATVTAELITISVANGSVAYGILSTSATEDTTTNGVDNTQIVTNNSNVAVDLSTISSNAIGGNQWDLADSIGADAFTHKFCVTDCDSIPVWMAFNPNSTTYVDMAVNIAATGGTQNFDLEIGTPSSVTDNILKTITVTVLAAKASSP